MDDGGVNLIRLSETLTKFIFITIEHPWPELYRRRFMSLSSMCISGMVPYLKTFVNDIFVALVVPRLLASMCVRRPKLTWPRAYIHKVIAHHDSESTVAEKKVVT